MKKNGRAASTNETGFGLRMININKRPFKLAYKTSKKVLFRLWMRWDYLDKNIKCSYVDMVEWATNTRTSNVYSKTVFDLQVHKLNSVVSNQRYEETAFVVRPISSIGKLIFKSKNIFHIVAISVVCQCYNCATVAMIQRSIWASLNFVGFTIRNLTILDGFYHSVSHCSHLSSLPWVIANYKKWSKRRFWNCLEWLNFFVQNYSTLFELLENLPTLSLFRFTFYSSRLPFTASTTFLILELSSTYTFHVLLAFTLLFFSRQRVVLFCCCAESASRRRALNNFCRFQMENWDKNENFGFFHKFSIFFHDLILFFIWILFFRLPIFILHIRTLLHWQQLC